jgi:hypothetical protein
MKCLTRLVFRAVTFAIVASGGLLVDDNALIQRGGAMIKSAEARIGRPLTPMSYAGVARRTTRRAVAVGAAATVGTAAAVAATSGCVQAVDPYGRVYTRCY